MATRLELRSTKEEILRLYAAYAPFGGNVVGIDAARWRYLGSDRTELSWAEAATLAVLQNAPSSIHLARNRDQLLAKRNRLLARLHAKGEINEEDYALALEEPLIGEPYPMPQYAPHLVEWYDRKAHGQRTVTHIDRDLQHRMEEVLVRWNRELRQRGSGIWQRLSSRWRAVSRQPIAATAICRSTAMGNGSILPVRHARRAAFSSRCSTLRLSNKERFFRTRSCPMSRWISEGSHPRTSTAPLPGPSKPIRR